MLDKFIAGAASAGAQGLLDQWKAEILAQRDAVLQSYRTQERQQEREWETADNAAAAAARATEREQDMAREDERWKRQDEAEAARQAEADKRWEAQQEWQRQEWEANAPEREAAGLKLEDEKRVRALRDQYTKATDPAERSRINEEIALITGRSDQSSWRQEETTDELGNTVKGDWVNTRDPSQRRPAGGGMSAPGGEPKAAEGGDDPRWSKAVDIAKQAYGVDIGSDAKAKQLVASGDMNALNDYVQSLKKPDAAESPEKAPEKAQEKPPAAAGPVGKLLPPELQQAATEARTKVEPKPAEKAEPPPPEAPMDRKFNEAAGGAEASLAMKQAETALNKGESAPYIVERLQAAMQHMDAQQKAKAEQLLQQLQKLPQAEPSMLEGLVGGLMGGR